MPSFQPPPLSAPLPRTYWVLENQLLAGAYAGQQSPEAHRTRLQGLLDAGARTFISLMEADETNNSGQPFIPYVDDLQQLADRAGLQVECHRFPIVDRSTTTHDHMEDILNMIDDSLARQQPAYVHCFGGIGRTGTVICCWLLRHGHATRDNVFELLKQLRRADVARSRRDAPENQQQKTFVLEHGERFPAEPITAPPATANDWFTRLTGFSERNPEEVRRFLHVRGDQLVSSVNDKAYTCGTLEIPSLTGLRSEAGSEPPSGRLEVSEYVGDARELHRDTANEHAVFQAASQFNLLEMVGPGVIPEEGVGIYQNDPTQGPACAISCGAGTIFRNYFVKLGEQRGQSADCQVDGLADIGRDLGNHSDSLWEMRNGYALPSGSGLRQVSDALSGMSESERDGLRDKLKVGVHWNTQVTLDGCSHLVTQVYGSAVPVAYSGLGHEAWEPFARLVLEASYEATLATAVLNRAKTGVNRVYLTLLGGGVFGNRTEWIFDAIARACHLYANHDLDVRIVSYRSSDSKVKQFTASLQTDLQERPAETKAVAEAPAVHDGSDCHSSGKTGSEATDDDESPSQTLILQGFTTTRLSDWTREWI